MLQNYIFSDAGFEFVKEFCETFDCSFRVDEPAGEDLVIDVGEKTFKIPSSETVDDFKKAVSESVKTGKNIVAKRYDEFPVFYEEDNDY